MELKRNEIIKALEFCANNDDCVGVMCPYYATGCENEMPKDALSLIKELTEENKKLTINMNAFGLTAKNLAEENKRLRAEVADLQDELKCEKETNKHLCDEYMSAKADAVRKMLQRIKEDAVSTSLLSNPPKFMLEIREDALDQIAKEMLEGENEN